ncbi:MAG: pilus assembly protein PilM [Bradymonadaceae bacterium]
MYELNYGFHENETVTLLDLGNSVISVNIVQDGITSFTRDLSLGGADITEEIQRQLNITYDEAEIYKMGSVSPEAVGDLETAAGEDEVLPQEVERIIQEQAGEIAEKLQESLNFYAASAADSHIDKIAVTGGTGAISSLRRTLSSMTDIEVELANPFRAIHWDEGTFSPDDIEEWAPIAGVAVGLALRRTDER